MPTATGSRAIFSLVDRVVLTPSGRNPGWLDAQLHGDLAGVLALSSPDKQILPAAVR
jgi:hypothetical protein